MKRIISLTRDSKGTIYMTAVVAPGAVDQRSIGRKLTPFKAGRLQQSICRFYREGRAKVRPWGGWFIGWEATIF